MVRLWLLFMAAALLPWLLLHAAEGDVKGNSDVAIIAKSEVKTDDQKQLRDRVIGYVNALPDGYSARVEYMTFAPSGEPLRFPTVLTPLNPEGEIDGTELQYVDWYRSPIRETPYVKGQRHGTERFYFEPQSRQPRAEVTWVEGQIQGTRTTFHPNGQKASETPYIDNQAQGASRSWSIDGHLTREVTFVNGQRHGKVVDYWPEAGETPQRSVTYNMGQVDGESKAFYNNGNLKWVRHFKANEAHGVERHYKVDGEIERERWWYEGELVTEAEFNQRSKE